MSAQQAIVAEGLSKQYRIGAGRHDTLRDLMVAAFSFRRAASVVTDEDRSFWALRDVDFQIARGESVGVLGLNGAGKSTLLKILSRITDPTSGQARVRGRLGALLEVGTGFQGELTGRENTFLYAAILGMRRAEIRRKFDAIVDFAGIEPFIDTPVKRYSSGMYVRLAFAVAAHLDPDILLLDEVLSVGDITFQQKCMTFAKKLQRSDATILFVSHNMFSIKTMCSRVIYLRAGRVVYDGPTEDGIALYEKDCRLAVLPWTEERPEDWPIVMTEGKVLDQAGRQRNVFDYGERMRIELSFEVRRPLESPNVIVAFIRSDGVAVCNYTTETDEIEVDGTAGVRVLELVTPMLRLVSEMYMIHILVRERGFGKAICTQVLGTFHVRHHLFDHHFGVFHEKGEWQVGRTTVHEKHEPHHCDL